MYATSKVEAEVTVEMAPSPHRSLPTLEGSNVTEKEGKTIHLCLVQDDAYEVNHYRNPPLLEFTVKEMLETFVDYYRRPHGNVLDQRGLEMVRSFQEQLDSAQKFLKKTLKKHEKDYNERCPWEKK